MKPIPVIAIFDVGKTNKKQFLFNEHYKIVFERTARFSEIADEDGFPCENLDNLRSSVFDSLHEVSKLKEFQVKAVNFSAYGASLVFVDIQGRPITPLYNYLKPYPEQLSSELYNTYGGEDQFAADTASPVLGSLNSGLVLFRLKKENPEAFSQLKYALHLPQYLSFLLSGKFYTDITSIGCHTAMWNFKTNSYHNWIEKEGLLPKLAPVIPVDEVLTASLNKHKYAIGVGLHDSPAALIPYQINFNEPFVLISTGTWCISMNPFNHSALTKEDLKSDCLCYLEYRGKAVKSSRLFAGHEHEQQVKRIAEHFHQDIIKFRTIEFEPQLIVKLKQLIPQNNACDLFFKDRDLNIFENETEAYHQLLIDIVHQQAYSTGLILKGTAVKRIFVDGGFSKNSVYMNLLANTFTGIEVFAASMAQASAIGAAIAIHQSWNSKPLPADIIALKYCSPGKTISI